jgi:hypothetical protein
MQHHIIAHQIEDIHKIDQQLRRTGTFDVQTDIENSEKIKAIYQQIGFPTIQQVGESASHHFVTILLHSPDIAFKKQCLQDMKQLSAEEVRQKDIPYLEDKIRIAEGEKQLYGTQLYFNQTLGIYEVMDLELPESVNERRTQFGLETLDAYIEYAQEVRKEMYGK